MNNPENDKTLSLRRKKMFYSRIFRPITTARLQVVAEKSGMYSWGDNNFIDFFSMVGGNEAKFGQAVDLGVGTRILLKQTT